MLLAQFRFHFHVLGIGAVVGVASPLSSCATLLKLHCLFFPSGQAGRCSCSAWHLLARASAALRIAGGPASRMSATLAFNFLTDGAELISSSFSPLLGLGEDSSACSRVFWQMKLPAAEQSPQLGELDRKWHNPYASINSDGVLLIDQTATR